jgi:tetratricopeptide (TPR) repeat protein
LPEEKALELFMKYYTEHQRDEDELFKQIRTAVGGNTLVIELLAKNLQNINKLESQYSLAKLLTDLQKQGVLALSNSTPVGVAYHTKGELRKGKLEDIIAAMYNLSELSDTEKALLSNFAVLPAENIPYKTLQALLSEWENLGNTLLLLAKKGWIDYDNVSKSFKISPVVQQIIKNKNPQVFADCQNLIYALQEKLDYIPGVGQFTNASYKEVFTYSKYSEALVNNFEQVDDNLSILFDRLGNYHKTTGNLIKAKKYYEESNRISKELWAGYPYYEIYKSHLSISYERLGTTLSSLGNLNKALEYYQEYNRLQEELHEAYPENVGFKIGLSISYEKLGTTHGALGDLNKALEYYKESNRLEEKLHQAYPENVEFKNGLSVSYEKLGTTHRDLGDLNKALEYYKESNRLDEELYEAYPGNVEFKNGLSMSYEKLGTTHGDLGDLNKALEYYKECNRLQEISKNKRVNNNNDLKWRESYWNW